MRKWLILIVIASPVVATETRVNTMGGVNYFLIDNSNIGLYPSLITDYPNEIIVEVRRPSIASFIGGGKFGVFGVGLNSDSVPSIVNIAIVRPDFVHHKFAPPQFGVYYGIKRVGIKLSAANTYYEESVSKFSQSISIYGGKIGVTYQFGGQRSMDLVGGMQRVGLETNYELGTGESVRFKDQGKYSFNGGVRILSFLSPVSLFIIGANYDKINVSWEKQGVGVKSEILTLECIEAYGGINFIPYSGTTVVFGLLVSKMEADTITAPVAYNSITYGLPKLIVAMETKLNDWFGVRIGANKTFNSMKLKTIHTAGETFQERIAEATFNLAIGWSIGVRNFELDIMCNELPFVRESIGLSATYKFSSF